MAVDTIARALALKAEGGTTPPDLSNYVQFDDFATPDKAGVINSGSNGFSVDASGNTSADVYTSEQYGGLGDNSFISKGTLENIKDDYVGSSTPVQDLTATVTNIQEKQDENMPKQTAEGTDNTITDALDMNLFALGGDGNSDQVVTQGYQLVDWENNFSKSTGVSFSFINDILIVNGVSGTAYQSVTYNITDVVKNNPGKTIKYSDYKHSITNNDTNSVAQIAVRYSDETPALYRVVCNYNTNQLSSYVVPSDISNIKRVDLSIFTNNSDNTNIDNTITIEKPLLYFDNNNIYEPYTGGQPSPSPDYPQEINSIEGSLEFACRGKNLLNNTLTSGTKNGITYTVNEDKSVTLNGTATTITWLILNNSITFSAGTYTMSQGNDNNNVRIFCGALNGYVENGIRTATLNEEKTSDVSINIPEGTTVSNFTIYPMIKEGSGTIEYEPYQSNKVTFNLNDEKLRSVGDVKDELVVDLETGDYYKQENIGEFDYNGLENSDISGTVLVASTIGQNLLAGVFNIFSSTSNATNKPTSNKFATKVLGSTSDTENPDNVRFFEGIAHHSANNTQFIISIEKTRLNSVDLAGFIQYFSNNPVKIQCSLATQTTKKLGTLSAEDLAKLKTFKGYNNVTVNTNLGLMNIRFTYGLDIKKYVDNKIAELSAQMIKGE